MSRAGISGKSTIGKPRCAGENRRRQRQRGAGAGGNRSEINTRIVAPPPVQLGRMSVRLGAYVSAGTHQPRWVPPQHSGVIANMERETQRWRKFVSASPPPLPSMRWNGEAFSGTVPKASRRRPALSSTLSPRITPPATLSKCARIPVRIAVKDGRRTVRDCAQECRCRSPLIPQGALAMIRPLTLSRLASY